MSETIRWGLLGCGSIARALATAIRETPDATLAAVGSRSLEKAQAFAAEFGAERAHGSYEALAEDAGVDVVYVATPHPMHRDGVLLCLDRGRAVLCEKPFALNAVQAREMVAKARQTNRFLMEAMWTRFFPITRRVRELAAEGAIGEIKLLAADFGFRAGFDPKSRLFAPELGGGALLDVGIYVASYASMLLGRPDSIVSQMKPARTGVDGQSAFVLGYPSGAMAVLYTSIQAMTPWEATIMGEKGSIRVHSPFWKPSRLTLKTEAGEETIDLPYEGNGYRFQVEEVGRCLRAGERESPLIPLDETIAVMETLDAIRRPWCLVYPGE